MTSNLPTFQRMLNQRNKAAAAAQRYFLQKMKKHEGNFVDAVMGPLVAKALAHCPKPPKNRFKRMKGWMVFDAFPVKSKRSVSIKDPYGFITALEKKGYKKLGSGCYSTVLGYPSSNKVIKVTRQNDNWIGFVKWAAKEGFMGTHVPKVYSYKNHGSWSVSLVERLEKTAYYVKREENARAIKDMFDLALDGNNLALKFCNDNQPTLGDFIEKIRPLNPGDLHHGNFMVRKDGALVLTDPSGHFPYVEEKRLREKDFRMAA